VPYSIPCQARLRQFFTGGFVNAVVCLHIQPVHGYPVLGNSRGGFPLPSSQFVIRVPSPRWMCLKRLSGLHLPRFEIRVFLLLGTVCLRHLLYPVLPSCPFSRAFPYPQPGDAGGRRSAPAVCQSLTPADTTLCPLTVIQLAGGLAPHSVFLSSSMTLESKFG